jgi:Ca-activated chloride channel family protein
MKTYKIIFRTFVLTMSMTILAACANSEKGGRTTPNTTNAVIEENSVQQPPEKDYYASPQDMRNRQSESVAKQSVANQPKLYEQKKEIGKQDTKGTKDKPITNVDDELSKGENTDDYNRIVENQFITPQVNPLSTFSIDVDNASYSHCRSLISGGQLPSKHAVRIEEFINYFDYEYPNPTGEHPFSITTEVAPAPWNPKHQLVHIGLQGKKIDYEKLAPSNLVFLLDVSGSMEDANKLPLLRSSLKLLLNELSEKDKIAIVVYAGAAGLVLPSTPASDKQKIIDALDKLQAGGSTAGGAGIELAYKIAKENFIKEGNNRIILATDGDFNVGVSSQASLVDLIVEKRKEGVFLTICGFGMGNYKDGTMEELSRNGNGNYYYIDQINEAKKVFVKEMRSTLFTIAKDVKLQVEFNPSKVQAYRLIGYENRMLKSEDFNDDKKDAGELGAGHTVTALYEIIPVGIESEFVKSVDKLKYQVATQNNQAGSNELLAVKFRYKKPNEEVSKLIEQTVVKSNVMDLVKTSNNFRFSAAVAEFGLLLRDSEFKGQANYMNVMNLAGGAIGKDTEGYRKEFIKMVENCGLMAKK